MVAGPARGDGRGAVAALQEGADLDLPGAGDEVARPGRGGVHGRDARHGAVGPAPDQGERRAQGREGRLGLAPQEQALRLVDGPGEEAVVPVRRRRDEAVGALVVPEA